MELEDLCGVSSHMGTLLCFIKTICGTFIFYVCQYAANLVPLKNISMCCQLRMKFKFTHHHGNQSLFKAVVLWLTLYCPLVRQLVSFPFALIHTTDEYSGVKHLYYLLVQQLVSFPCALICAKDEYSQANMSGEFTVVLNRHFVSLNI